jgi:hypothetical protein
MSGSFCNGERGVVDSLFCHWLGRSLRGREKREEREMIGLSKEKGSYMVRAKGMRVY